MKNLLSIFLTCLISSVSNGKEIWVEPIHWDFSVKKLDPTHFELHMFVKIDKGWHIYAQIQPKSSIGVPTSFEFSKNPLVQLKGKPKEIGERQENKNEEIGITQYQYSDHVEFVQLVQLKSSYNTNISGTVHFMACTDQKCLPEAKQKFTILLQ